MKVSLVVTLGFLWLISVSSSVDAQSSSGIQNGSFEAPSIASYAYRPSGSNWTFIASAGIQHNNSAWGAPNAPDRVQTAFLQDGTTGGNGTISQVFNVPTADTYSVSFYSALRAYRTSSTIMSFKVTMDGTNITFSPTSTAFSQFTTSQVVLTAGSHTLSFVGTGAGPDTSDFIDFVTLDNTSAQLLPSNISPPKIAGTPQVGQTLTGTTGTWNNATSFAEQWFGNGVLLPGVTGLSYTPQSSDICHVITETVTATGPGGTASATSVPTMPVQGGKCGSFELVQGKDVVSLDTDGNEILSQSGDVRKFGDTYYWYGDRIVNGVRSGIACYSSKDLAHWKFESVVHSTPANPPPDPTFEPGMRPSVVYNSLSQQYVMIFQRAIHFATSTTPCGQFVDQGYEMVPNDRGGGDRGVFLDDDGKVYVVYATWPYPDQFNTDIGIVLLTPDYLHVDRVVGQRPGCTAKHRISSRGMASIICPRLSALVIPPPRRATRPPRVWPDRGPRRRP